MITLEMIREAAMAIHQQSAVKPEIGMILGSGLGVMADEVENPTVIRYETIPHFPVSTVEGHAGELVIGTLSGKGVVMMKGRFHLYEGYEPSVIAFPIRVLTALGISRLIVTNAAGGVNESFLPGDLMLITDHLNLAGANPLIGKNDDRLGPRFPDMSSAYNKDMMRVAERAAAAQGVTLRKGVYAWFTGPNYETPAEVRMSRVLGADAVGMSTVPEVLVAVHGGVNVLGISCITNMAAGMLDQPLSHQEVMETAQKVEQSFKQLVRDILAGL
ncbi:MAG: purine-nucleoside phosphorylase [Bacillota bacterium]|nr:purine-nucleoside phosphorylase [Bacillota bacterium]